MDAALQRCNIRISNYVSNVDSKGYLEVVDLLSKGCTDPESLANKIHGRTINKHGWNTIKAALTGVVTDVDSDLLRQYKEELELLKKHRQECLMNCFFNSFSYRMVTIREKGRLKVQVAIARKLLVVIWNILAKGVCYSEKIALSACWQTC